MFYFSVYRNYTKTKKPRQANDGVLSAKEKFSFIFFRFLPLFRQTVRVLRN